MKFVLTDRDRELFKLLSQARWLSTAQIGRRFFPGVSMNAVSKRLRRLVSGGLLFGTRPERTGESFFRLTRQGAGEVGEDVVVPRKLPAQLKHRRLINDIRLWLATCSMATHRFLAEWEFRLPVTKESQVPDAVLVVNVHGHERRLAVEVDCGTENASVLAKKLRGYGGVLTSGRLSGVVMFLPGQRRIKATVAACFKLGVLGDGQCWVVDLDKLRNMDANTKSFLNLQSLTAGEPVIDSLHTLLASPFSLSLRRERTSSVSAEGIGVSSAVDSPMYVES
jgi:hypothetical protein